MPRFRQFIALALVVGLAASAGCLGMATPRSESTYTGYVVDVEYEKGLLFKNTQIHLKTHPRSSAVENFCVIIPEDEQFVQTARDALIDQQRVAVTYERPFYVNPGQCAGGSSLVKDIEVLNQTADTSTVAAPVTDMGPAGDRSASYDALPDGVKIPNAGVG